MNWRYRETEMNLLARTVALLFSLADMAANAAFASPRRRRELLDTIRIGEGAGLRLAADLGKWHADVELPQIGDGYEPEDAFRLAVSLRAVAMALYFQVRLGEMLRKADRPEYGCPTSQAGFAAMAIHPRQPPMQEIPLVDTS